MIKAYWIGRIDVSDPHAYQAYVQANAAAFAEFGGRFLVRGGAFETVEGASRSRNVVIEFPSQQAALACWHSPAYQAARAHRLGAAVVDLLVVEAYDGPQPGAPAAG